MYQSRFYFLVGAMVLFLSLRGQDINEKPLFTAQPIPKGPYIFPVENAPIQSIERSEKRINTSQRRPTGYVYETGTTDLIKLSEVKLAYTLPSIITYSSFYSADTSEIRHYEMDSSFDYNYRDIISIINPGGFNGYFLREQGGSLIGNYLSSQSKQKINGKWVLSGKADDRVQVSYGYEYGNQYSFSNLCPNSLEYQSKGEWKEEQWIYTMDITVRDCQTLTAKEYWREIRRFDDKHRKLEWSSYKKTGDSYLLEYHDSFKYDEQGREIEKLTEGGYPNPEILKKYIQTYDEKGNSLLATYELNGTLWVQTSKTMAERTSDDSYVYTHQYFKNNMWQDGYREKYQFDISGRVSYSSEERWNDVSKTWDLKSYDLIKYYTGDLVSERESYSNWGDEDEGYKQLIGYDENESVKMSQTFKCSTLGNCQQRNYVPTYKAYYEDRDDDKLDYFTSYLFTSDQKWVRFDSVANRYSENDEIVESFWRGYDGNYPEKISFQNRYTFTYDTFVIMEAEEQEKSSAPYPNPVNNILHLDQDLKPIFVTDVTGKELNHPKIDFQNGKTIIDMSYFLPGMYFIKVSTTSGKLQVHKVIKQ
jgi:hypothetical protein